MILPLISRESAAGGQRLVLIELARRGFTEKQLDPVRFVPLETGKA
jgi:hypothetical protein